MISIVIISKDEPELEATLAEVRRQADELPGRPEIIVVDASEGRLDGIRARHEPAVRWIRFDRPPGVPVTIPHQRNAGVRAAAGDIVVFTDAGCVPRDGWLSGLTRPLLEGEQVTAGRTLDSGGEIGLYGWDTQESQYLRECPTINMSFRKEVFDVLDGFDESFAYGSDVDFSWRLGDAGYKIRCVPEAVVLHDWGTWRRQLRRSFVYGQARARLYRKHRARRGRVLRDDPIAVVYPVFLLGLPLTLLFPWYPALLLIPAWRNRSRGAVRVVVDHLVYGAGVLAELVFP